MRVEEAVTVITEASGHGNGHGKCELSRSYFLSRMTAAVKPFGTEGAVEVIRRAKANAEFKVEYYFYDWKRDAWLLLTLRCRFKILGEGQAPVDPTLAKSWEISSDETREKFFLKGWEELARHLQYGWPVVY